MLTKVENPDDEDIGLEIEVNGQAHHYRAGNGGITMHETPLPSSGSSGPQRLAVTYRSSRKLVLLETDFR